MGSTYHSIHYHAVFSTKDRRPLIRDEWRADMHSYLGGTARGLSAVAEAVGGVDDHVHPLLGMRPIQAPADIVRELKKASSVWAASKHERRFRWQNGYAIFSVSWTHISTVRGYIARQEAHHRDTGFVDELKRLLNRNGIEFDPRYLS
jgi:REP element-mobilizing transposase RayT